METLEQLKAVVKNAPEGKSHVCMEGGEISYWNNEDCDCLAISGDGVYLDGMRSLSDIKRIIELIEGQKKAYQAYVSLEEVKQKYNGQNKIAKALLKLAYECDEFELPGDLRKDIKEFLGDL